MIASKHWSLQSGHLYTLTEDEGDKLRKLWSLIIRFCSLPLPRPLNIYSKAELCGMARAPGDQPASESSPNVYMKELIQQCGHEDLDCILLRYLRARKWMVVDAFVLLADALQWRYHNEVHQMLIKGEAGLNHDLYTSGLIHIWNENRNGHVCIYIKANIYNIKKHPLEDIKALSIYTVEMARRLRSHDEQLIDYIVDAANVDMRNCDLNFCLFLAEIFEARYPETLGCFYLIDVPWLFVAFWNLFKRFLNPLVASKVNMMKREELMQVVEPDVLLAELGGHCSYQFKPSIFLEETSPNDVDVNAPERQLDAAIVELISFHQTKANRPIDNLDIAWNALKARIRILTRHIYELSSPKSHYHRIGILNDEGEINWSAALNKLD